jgi:signal transduction histidine kinase/DNA-binding response OmpR family regulator/ligand-binding sensor domain-containing protein
LIICFALTVFAEDNNSPLSGTYSLHNWNTEDQLPQSSVNAIVQSADGYLWIGTFGGIAKFDGVVFEHIQHPELIYERVISLFEDCEGYLWIGSENNGLYRYKEGEVKHYDINNGFPGVGITSIFQYGKKVGVLIQGKGIALISDDHIEFKQSRIFDGELLEQAIIDDAQRIWIVSSKGVFLLENIYTDPIFIENSYHEQDGFAISNGVDQNLYFGNQEGFFKIEEKSLHAKFLFKHNIGFLSRQFKINQNGDFWYGAKGNEIYCRSDQNTFKWGKEDGVPNGEISCIYEDKSGNIWVGLNGGGLLEFYKNQVSVLGQETILSSKIFLAVHDDDRGRLWLATNNGGFFMLDTITQKVTEFNAQNSGLTADIWSLASNKKGDVWGGTFGNGIFHINRNTAQKFDLIREWGGASQVVLAMLFDSINNRLLIGSDQGGVFQLKDGQWTNIIPDHINQNRITKFTLSPQGEIYIATQGDGIKVLKGNKVTHIDESKGLSFNSIRDVFFDSEGIMWLGSYGKGIIVRLNDTFITINSKHGLFDNLISTVREDEQGYLWMSCNSGVFRAKRSDLLDIANGKLQKVQCQVFNKSHGMGHSETNGGFQSSSIQLPNGSLLYPTMKGIAVFNPKSLFGIDTISNIVISKISFGDTVVYSDEEIIIPAEYRDVAFTFTAPTFFAPELITFKYILEGYENEWSFSGTNRIAGYKKLAPGKYTFKVRARNSQGVWSETYTSQKLVITPYFYETSLFKWVLGFSILLLIFGGYVWQNQRAEKREVKLKKIVQERTSDLEKEKKVTEEALLKVEDQSAEIQKMSAAKSDFFQSISHELKTPLTLIKGPVESILDSNENILQNNVREDLTLVKKQANYLTDLISQLLDIARSEDGYLKKQEQRFNILDLVQRVVISVESWTQQKEIHFQSSVNLSRVNGVTDIDFLEKIIRNVLTNAIKFTPPQGIISLNLEEVGDDLIIRISDSGSGINKEDLPHIFDRYYTTGNVENGNATGTGIGLALVKEFTQLLDGEIKVGTSINGGAEFICKIPFYIVDDKAEDFEIPVALGFQPKENLLSEEVTEERILDGDQKPLILVVDDHSDIRNFIRKSIDSEYRVVEAENGNKGYEKALELIPDIIISDINMPELDGLGMLNHLKSNSNTDYIPVLLLTARGSDQIKVKGWDEGADGYMSKPFNAKELQARLKGILENRKKLRKRVQQELDGFKVSEEKSDFERKFEQIVHMKLTNPEYSFNENLGDFAMSLSKFQKWVKENYGMTPQVYLRLKRLEMAKSLIEKKSGSISEIAYACGFNSVSYFNRTFKKEYQITPSDLI